MSNLARGLVWAAVLAFILAVITTFTGSVGPIWPEGLSRASNNLALIAIAMLLMGTGSERRE